jgi:hypothetical protein
MHEVQHSPNKRMVIHKRVLLGAVAVVVSLAVFAGILALAENAQQRVDLATQEHHALH